MDSKGVSKNFHGQFPLVEQFSNCKFASIQVEPAVPSLLPGIGNPNSLIITNLPKPLTNDEKRYLLAVERGDLASVRR